jgi:hypothetical protein
MFFGFATAVGFQFRPDSAVAAKAMSKEQTFRNEQSLSLKLIRLWRKWVCASERISIIGGSR